MPKRTPRKPAPSPNIDPPESQAADALTVLWLLLAFTTLFCEVGWLAARWYTANQAAEGVAGALQFLLAFTAIVTGALTLAFTPVVLKVRKLAPPPAITIAAMAIGAAPFFAALILTMS